MPGKQVIIEVSPSRLEVAVHRTGGAPFAKRADRLDNIPLNSDWAGTLESLLPRLTAMVEELDVRGTPATIIYSGSTTASATVSSCPVSTGRAGAERAASLALASICTFPLDGNCQDSVLIATDQPPRGKKKKDDAGTANQYHTLGVADSLESTRALANWAKRAGLVPVRLLPADAAACAAAVRNIAEDSATAPADGAAPEPVALLWLGEQTSVLATGLSGRVVFARAIGVGVETFVDALTRPLRPRGMPAPDQAEPALITLDRVKARDILEKIGIPAADREIEGLNGVIGATLLPALQPVLQRLGVEIKQSLRFGLPEGDRTRVKLVVSGPGATINGLAPIIARQSGLPSAEQKPIGAPGSPSSESGAIAAALGPGSTDVNLLPSDMAREITFKRVKQAMWAGVGVALLFVGFDTVTTRMAFSQERGRLDDLRTQAQHASDLAASHELARQARRDITGAEARVRASLGSVADWSVALAVLADRTPRSVRLTSIDLLTTDDGPRCKVRGFCLLRESSTPIATIKQFIRSLEEVPIFSNASLGTTRRIESRLGEAQDFEITIPVVALPAAMLHANHAQTTAAPETGDK